MLLKFEVEVEVTKTTGRFVSRETLSEELAGILESSDPGSLDIDGSEYEVTNYTVVPA